MRTDTHSSDLVAAAHVAAANVERLSAWRIRWLMRYGWPPTGTAASVARADLLFPDRAFRGRRIDLSTPTGTQRPVPDLSARLHQPAHHEQHGNGNRERMLRYRHQYRRARLTTAPAVSD